VTDAVDFHSVKSADFLAGYTRSAAFRERYAIWAGLIDNFFRPGGTVLDVGCGPGLFTSYAARTAGQAIGVDGSAEMLVLAQGIAREKGLGNATFLQMRVEDVPHRIRDEFDLVLCSSVLEYLDDLSGGLDLLCGRVKAGGRLIFSLPNAWSPYRAVERIFFTLTGKPSYYRYVRHVVTWQSLHDRLAAQGMTVEHVDYFGSILKLDRSSNWLRPKAIFNNMFVAVCRKTSPPEV
jgi:2-polyprenyl-3-methyl-5-hydroxy-6-metoxy-1,4-benzoquinol methylase